MNKKQRKAVQKTQKVVKSYEGTGSQGFWHMLLGKKSK